MKKLILTLALVLVAFPIGAAQKNQNNKDPSSPPATAKTSSMSQAEACLAKCRADRKASGTGSGGESGGGYCMRQCGLQ